MPCKRIFLHASVAAQWLTGLCVFTCMHVDAILYSTISGGIGAVQPIVKGRDSNLFMYIQPRAPHTHASSRCLCVSV